MDNNNLVKSSKYFQPGYIFKKTKENLNENKTETKNKESDNEFDDDLDCEDLDEIISQSSFKLPDKKPKGSEERIKQLESQQIDFIAIQNNTAALPSLKGNNTILVNSNQQKNPLLKHLHFVRIVITDSIAPAHYVLYDNCCALFLSLKYHVIKPDYIYDQVKELRNKYQLSLLIVMIDHLIYEPLLKELTIMAVRANFTLLVAWSFEEAAKHIENYRMNADRSPAIIMGKGFDDTSSSSSLSQKSNSSQSQSLIDALTSVKHINRTNAITLLSVFDTVENLVDATTDELSLCPGISMVKAKQLHSIFNRPFIKK